MEMAMIARRHMIDYGTTEEQFGEVAVALRRHAIRNPNAVMSRPMTLEDHRESRYVAEPLRLFDCNIETDGAVAMVVTSTERARDLRRRPAIIHEGALAAGSLTTVDSRACSPEAVTPTAPSERVAHCGTARDSSPPT